MTDLLPLIGWMAGAIIAIAAIPKLWNRITAVNQRDTINTGDLIRDSMIVGGNLLWILFGYFNSLPMIVLFCGVNAILTGVLVAMNLKYVAKR